MPSLKQLHNQQWDIFEQRMEAGVVSTRTWLYGQQARLNTHWPDLAGEELLAAQGEARAYRRLIDVIENQPRNPRAPEA